MRPLALHNLPTQATSFIGRERELAEIQQALAGTRLLTLTGAGGTGKTRLALETARLALGACPHGVWLVQLAGLTDPALVPHAAAASLGLQESRACCVEDLLPDYLADKDLLLVLDNCEHLISACATLADALLSACPSIRILATSREPLAIPWEMVWPVPPLPPEAEGVQLFVARARAAKPSFEPSPAVAEICRRLDGLPLAIELAAARVRVLTPEQIAERLDDPLHLLTGGSRSLPLRQQTMKAAIDWSYELLSEPERALFRRLSVFAGGFTLEAAEHVTADPNALDLLTGLLDKSLVLGDAPRYRLLEPVRQYAREQLKAHGEESAARERHLSYYCSLMEKVHSELLGPRQGAWLTRLETEHDNIHLALEWSLQHDPPAGLRLAARLRRYWPLRGRLTEGRRWLHLLLALCPEPTETRALALLAVNSVAEENPRPLVEESHRIFTDLGHKSGIAWSGMELAMLLHQQQRDLPLIVSLMETSKAIFQEIGLTVGLANVTPLIHCAEPRYSFHLHRYMEERLGLLREAGDTAGIVRCLTDLAGLHVLARKIDLAAGRLREAVPLAQELGDKQGLVRACLTLGEIAQKSADPAQAREMYEQSLRYSREIGDVVRTTQTLCQLGSLAVDTHQPQEAKQLLMQALRTAREIGWTAWIRNALVYLSLAHLQLQEYEQARMLIDEAIGISRQEEVGGGLAWCLRVLGIIEGEQGRYGEALRWQRESLSIDAKEPAQTPGHAIGVCMTGIWLIGDGRSDQGLRLIAAAETIHPLKTALEPLERPYLQPALDRARAALGAGACDRARAAGLALTAADAVNEALGARQQATAGLTARELDVVRLVAQGLSDRDVAARLFISPRTVDTHLRNIFDKAGVDSRTALTAWALRNHIT